MPSDKIVLHQKDSEFFVYAEPHKVEQWRKDKSIPLVDVVQAFNIYEGSGNKPSKQSLA
jgi:ribosome maturation protein Sdo1